MMMVMMISIDDGKNDNNYIIRIMTIIPTTATIMHAVDDGNMIMMMMLMIVVVMMYSCVCLFVFKSQQHTKTISGKDLPRQVHVLPHWNRSCRSNLLFIQSQHTETGPTSPRTDPLNAECPAGS